tara:strand:+ start:4129 stop:5661 length:1533 start_codon:yes stop_codon:yes gene_type:complete
VFSIKYLGHAGWLVQTDKFKAICDPWFAHSGAFLDQWYPFPDNRDVFDLNIFLNLDFVYISHAHEDHYNEWLLKQLDKQTTIFIPDFKCKRLYNNLKKLGFINVRQFTDSCKTTIKEVSIKIIKDENYLDNDSCILFEYKKTKILNLNDCHLSFTELRKKIGSVDILLLQSSSAIWFPCTYEYSPEKMKKHGRAKRQNVLNRTLEYSKRLNAKLVIPNAGPPVINNEQAEKWNYNKDKDWNPFVLPVDSSKFLRDNNIKSEVVLPGESIEITDNTFMNTTKHDDVRRIYSDVDSYTRKYLASLPPETTKTYSEEQKNNSFELFRQRVFTLKKLSKFFCHRVAHPTLFNFHELGSWVMDFKKDTPFVKYTSQPHGYSFSIQPNDLCAIMEQKINDFEILFLSMKFSCKREPDTYDEMLFAILKYFDVRRFLQSEKLFASRKDIAGELFNLKVGKKTCKIQKYCPHMFANLEEVGQLEGDKLVCPLHGWKFDLKTGNCLNKEGYKLKVIHDD